MKSKALFTLLVLPPLLSFAWPSESQETGGLEKEQTTFGGEEVPGIPFIKHPVTLPDYVLEILKQDDTVKSCLADNTPTANTPLSSWFVASEVHLHSPQERDLVVLPSPSGQQPGYMCFHSAEGFTSFWIFRQTEGQYKLVLRTNGFGIGIKKSKHLAYRDIETGSPSAAGKFLTTVSFRFDGKQYREYREQTQSR